MSSANTVGSVISARGMSKRYGKRKLYRQKSYVGSSAFFLTGVICSLGYLFAFHPELGVSARVLAALCAAFVATIAELFTTRLDDNLTVPIAAAVAAAFFI